MDGFSTGEAAATTGTNSKTLAYWDTTNFLRPSLARADGKGTRRSYSFSDLVAIRAVRTLRDAGISLQALRRTVKYLRQHQGELRHPMQETFLLTDGVDVYIRPGDTLVSALREPGQGLLFHVLDLSRTVDELHNEVLRLEAATSAKARARAPSEAG
jgi:DNA-binding transcriptional MerR regulator